MRRTVTSHTSAANIASAVASRRTRKEYRRPVPDPITSDREYTDAEREYLRAVQEYQARHRVRFLNVCDYLHVALSLGYVKA